MDEPRKQDVPFRINIIVTDRKGYPAIELRRTTSDPELIKNIVSCAYHQRPIIVMPSFSDYLKGMASLKRKGIIHQVENGKFYFNI